VSAPARPYRRVVVAIDASPHSLAALQAAVDLAASQRFELLAVFVEDLRLLQATALPFAREVATFSGVARPLDVAQTERRLRDLARRVEALVSQSADRAEVPWTFRVRRGDVAAEILACAEAGDVLSLGAAGWSPMRARALGETAGRLLRQAHGPMLLARHGNRLAAPLLALLEGEDWQQVLEAAVALSGAAPGALLLAIPPGPAQAAREVEAQARLAERALGRAASRLLAGAGPAAIRALIRRERAGALLLPSAASALAGEQGERLLATLDVPVIVLHGRQPASEAGERPGRRHEQSPLG